MVTYNKLMHLQLQYFILTFQSLFVPCKLCAIHELDEAIYSKQLITNDLFWSSRCTCYNCFFLVAYFAAMFVFMLLLSSSYAVVMFLNGLFTEFSLLYFGTNYIFSYTNVIQLNYIRQKTATIISFRKSQSS